MAYGGNVFWRTSDRATILTLIMRHGATFEGLSQVFFRQREPWTVVQLSQTDRWLAAIYEYTDPKFRNAFKSCLSEYRTGLEASQILPSINMVVSEMQHAPARDRVEFLKIVSKWGTADMILPFIRAGVDLDEKLSNEQTPWLRLSYLSKAARCKNLNTFQTLLDAGACPARALIYLSRHPDNLPLCRRMILTLAERAKPQHLEVYNGELLALLLRTDHVRRYSSSAAGALIDRFILRRHFNFNECEKLFNSYVLVSVLLDLPAVLQHFYSTVSTICGNKPICKVSGNQYVSIKSAVAGKYTWLTFAVHLGLAACVKVFLDNGAHCEEPDPCGQTALQMAKDYVSGPHPRATTELQIWPYQPPQRSVSIEDDQKVLATLHHAAVTRAALTTRSEYHDSWGGTSEPLRTDKLPLQACSGPNDRSIWARVLGNDAVIVTSGLHNLEGLARVIRCDGPIRKLWTIAVRLSRLTLTEAVLLRAGYMLSLIALMLCLIVEFFWH